MMTLHTEMVKRYNENAFTHNYIYGITYKGVVYMIHDDATDMVLITKLDKASRGAGYALRFKPTKEQKTYLMAKGAVAICSKEFFEAEVANSKYNKGEIFEKMITEYYGQQWEKDSVPFTEDGDITVDGIAYQIKFEAASFCTEKSLANLTK